MIKMTDEQFDALLVLGRLAAEIVLSGSEGLCSPEITEAIRTDYVLLYPPQRGLTEQERQWAREIDMTGVEAELNPAPPILTLGDKVRRTMGESTAPELFQMPPVPTRRVKGRVVRAGPAPFVFVDEDFVDEDFVDEDFVDEGEETSPMPERYNDEGLFGRTWHGGDWNNAISREMLDLQRTNKALAEQNRALVKQVAHLAESVTAQLNLCPFCRTGICTAAAHNALRAAVQQATGKEAI